MCIFCTLSAVVCLCAHVCVGVSVRECVWSVCLFCLLVRLGTNYN